MAQVQGEQNTTNGPSVRAGAPGEGSTARIGEAAAQSGRSFAKAASDAGHDAARTNAEVLRRGVETTGEAVQAGLKTAETTLQGVAETFGRAFGVGDERAAELADRSAANMRTVSEATAILAQGAQAASREWMDLAQRNVRARLEAAQRLAGCRSAPDLFAVQSELCRESLQRSVEASQTVVRTSLKAIEDAGRAIQAQAR